MNFGFESLVGFRIPWAVFGIPKANFPKFRIQPAKISRILGPDSPKSGDLTLS